MIVEDPLAELQQKIQDIEVDYGYEDVYNALHDAVDEYCDAQGDWDLLYECFESEDGVNCIITYEQAEDEARRIMEDEGGLVRLYYYMGDCNFNDNLFYCNGYGNLEHLDISQLERLKSHILECIEERLDEEGFAARSKRDEDEEEE